MTIKEKEIIDIARSCKDTLVEKKAEDVVVLNLADVNSYLDYFIICSGNSKIHCKSLAKEVQKYFGDTKMQSRINPDTESEWIVLDYSEIVVHIFTEETRAYYNLEKLWADAENL